MHLKEVVKEVPWIMAVPVSNSFADQLDKARELINEAWKTAQVSRPVEALTEGMSPPRRRQIKRDIAMSLTFVGQIIRMIAKSFFCAPEIAAPEIAVPVCKAVPMPNLAKTKEQAPQLTEYWTSFTGDGFKLDAQRQPVFEFPEGVTLLDLSFAKFNPETNTLDGIGPQGDDPKVLEWTPQVIKAFVDQAHNQGKKVIISIGGATYPYGSFDTGKFTSAIQTACSAYGFDGVDFDWEDTSLEKAAQIGDLIHETRKSLGDSAIISLTVKTPQSQVPFYTPILKKAFADLTTINLMEYDLYQGATLTDVEYDILGTPGDPRYKGWVALASQMDPPVTPEEFLKKFSLGIDPTINESPRANSTYVEGAVKLAQLLGMSVFLWAFNYDHEGKVTDHPPDAQDEGRDYFTQKIVSIMGDKISGSLPGIVSGQTFYFDVGRADAFIGYFIDANGDFMVDKYEAYWQSVCAQLQAVGVTQINISFAQLRYLRDYLTGDFSDVEGYSDSIGSQMKVGIGNVPAGKNLLDFISEAVGKSGIALNMAIGGESAMMDQWSVTSLGANAEEQAKTAVAFMKKYNIHTLDCDYELIGRTPPAELIAFYLELHRQCEGTGKTLTLTITANPDDVTRPDSYLKDFFMDAQGTRRFCQMFDGLNIMAYANGGRGQPYYINPTQMKKWIGIVGQENIGLLHIGFQDDVDYNDLNNNAWDQCGGEPFAYQLEEGATNGEAAKQIESQMIAELVRIGVLQPGQKLGASFWWPEENDGDTGGRYDPKNPNGILLTDGRGHGAETDYYKSPP